MNSLRSRPGDPRQRGSSVAGFVMVLPLALAVFLACVGIVVTGYVRTEVTSAAQEAARSLSLHGASAHTAEQTVADRLHSGLVAADAVEVSTRRVDVGGVPIAEVDVTVQIRSLWLGPPRTLSVTGRAVDRNRWT